MTFLNPLVLFGLLAAAIPIILHLFNLRKLKTVEFSTLQFLKELQRTKMRRVKIKQWLLLALRTLLIIAVVMAFSRPALRSSLAGFGTVSSHARTTAVVLLDDSPSMSVRNEKGQLFAQAKEATKTILELLKEGDEAYLVPLSQIRRTAAFSSSHDVSVLKTALEQADLSYDHVPYREAVGVAAKLLAESRNVNRELYLVSDGQATQFVYNASDTANLFDDRAKVFVVDVQSGGRMPQNVGVTNVEVLSRILARDKPAVLRVTVHNSGPSAVRGALLSVYIDGERVQQQSLDIPDGGSVSPVFVVTPKRSGMLTGYAQLEDDALEADNRRWFVLNVPQSIAVLCVGGSANDTRIPALALSLDRDSVSQGLFDVQSIPETQLASQDLRRNDVMVLANVRDFSTGEAERIEQFVAAGGGVILFPGPGTDIENYNAVLFRRLGIPPVRPAPPIHPDAAAQTSFLSFSTIDFDHQLFAGLFEQSQGKSKTPAIESPRVFTTITPNIGQTGTPLIVLSDGTSFLTEYRHGAGTVLLFSVEAATTWSDFPLKPIFVPLLYRSGQYLAQGASVPSLIIGEQARVPLRLKRRVENAAFVLRSPSGIEERIVPTLQAGTGTPVFASSSITEPGIYELREQGSSAQSEVLLALPANIAAQESDLRRVDPEAIERFFAGLGVLQEQVRSLPAGDDISRSVLESRYGVELWKLFVLLAIAFALAEMVVARTFAESKVE